MSSEWITCIYDRSQNLYLLISRPQGAICDLYDDINDPATCLLLITISEPCPWWHDWRKCLKPAKSYCASLSMIGPEVRFPLWPHLLNVAGSYIGRTEDTAPSGFLIQNGNSPRSVRQISFILSDVVLITGKAVTEAPAQFSQWIHDCKVFKDKRKKNYTGPRPRAVVVIDLFSTKGVGGKEFEDICLQQDEAENLDREALNVVFDDFRVLNTSCAVYDSLRSSIAIARR